MAYRTQSDGDGIGNDPLDGLNSATHTKSTEYNLNEKLAIIIVDYFNRQKIIEKKISDSNKKLIKAERKIARLEKTISESQNQQKENLKLINEANRDIRGIRDKTLEPLAVFVGFFTFASISFSTLANKIDSKEWISIILIAAGMMLIFPSLVLAASSVGGDNKRRYSYTKWVIIVGVLLVITGCVAHFI